MPEIPAQIGKYPISRLLGQGAMGKVYLGEDPFIGRQVAIKVLSTEGDDEAHRRFLEEARTIGQLAHPNIVTLLEFGFHDGSPFLVMELLRGESLESWLGRSHGLAELLRVVRDLCLAVAHAHAHGVLHRDIKPSNAQVLPDGSCKLMDFGIARSERVKLTATGMVVGTPQFIAPEVLRDAAYTSASDLYALGLVAYQVISGQNPFAAGNLEACLTKVLTLTPPPLGNLRSDLPGELASRIDACLAKDPARRPTVDQLLESLERALATVSGKVDAAFGLADTARATYPLRVVSPATGLPPPASNTAGRLAKRIALGVTLVAALSTAWLWKNAGEKAAPAAGPSSAAEATRPPLLEPAAVPESAVEPVAQQPALGANLQPKPKETTAAPLAEGPKPQDLALREPPASSSAAATLPAERGISAADGESGEAAFLLPTETAKNLADVVMPEPAGPTPPVADVSTRQQEVEASPTPPVERPVPVLVSLSPAVVRRGSSTSLEISGEGLGEVARVVIQRGRQPAGGMTVRKLRQVDTRRVQLTLFVDSNVALGLCTLQIVDGQGNVSNSLSLEVGL